MHRFTLLTILGLLLGACATSPDMQSNAGTQMAPAAGTQAVAANTTVAQTDGAATQPKLICIEDTPIGSHIPKRVCLTPEQMEARQKAAQAAMRRMEVQGNNKPGNSNAAGGGG